MRFLTPNEVAHLANEAEHHRVLVLTAAYTGLRWGEVAALKRESVNHLLAKTVTVTQTLSEVGGHVAFGPPKTAAARRTVSLPGFLRDELSRHMNAQDGDLIFAGTEGGPLRRTNFRRRDWLPAVRRSVGEPLRFHDLRHTHVALLIEQDEHPKVIADRLGHTSARVVLDRYGHLFEGLDAAAADRLDTAYSQTLAASTRPNSDASVIPFPAGPSRTQ